MDQLSQKKPYLYINPEKQPSQDWSSGVLDLSMKDVLDAEARLVRFGPMLAALFPELKASNGIIESQLLHVPHMQADFKTRFESEFFGNLWLKADHSLPVAGSIKARGGVYEVLCIAEDLALKNSILTDINDDYKKLLGADATKLFSQYTISVGSTGNLGLSVGIMSSSLGFKAHVHMSVEAKQWKKERLRKNGVLVVEHQKDYSAAVEQGRTESAKDPFSYFIDDENSKRLFLGYSVAALRLKAQFQEKGIVASEDSPIFVYIPCGVGGAPGGVTFGLKLVFGDHVHCFFAEPDDSPCVILMMLEGTPVPVYKIGLQNKTEADGLAVGTASKLVHGYIKNLLSGGFTVQDNQLFQLLSALKDSEGIEIEPSAAAGFFGPKYLFSSETGKEYLAFNGITKEKQEKSHHVVWTTGGLFVPKEEYTKFYEKGKALNK